MNSVLQDSKIPLNTNLRALLGLSAHRNIQVDTVGSPLYSLPQQSLLGIYTVKILENASNHKGKA